MCVYREIEFWKKSVLLSLFVFKPLCGMGLKEKWFCPLRDKLEEKVDKKGGIQNEHQRPYQDFKIKKHEMAQTSYSH
jgi:hypothetical protein